MSTHNIYFHRETRKILYGYPVLPGAIINRHSPYQTALICSLARPLLSILGIRAFFLHCPSYYLYSGTSINSHLPTTAISL